MVRVSSADVLQMEDARFADVLADLSAKQSSGSKVWVLLALGAISAVFAAMFAGAVGFIIGVMLTVIAGLLGGWLDSFQRSSVLMYDLEDDSRRAYEALAKAFDGLSGCVGKWHIDAGGAVRDLHSWKRNAGAGHIVDKRPTTFDYSLPRVVKSNITPPAIKSGKETLYFLPDFLLVVESEKVGAVAYDNLSIEWQDSNFIENEAVPADTQILYHTWKHPNKSGGPDRRFANNHQIPVCLYESIYLTSTNGLNELLQISRSGVTAPFAQAVRALAAANGSSRAAEALPALGSN
jgi:hypothetical protein